MRLKKLQEQKTLKLDLRVLKKLATPFRIELKNRFDTLKDEEPSIEKINKILRESMDTIQSKTQKSTIKLRIEDTEIEKFRQEKERTATKNKQNTKRQGRTCRNQQISET